LQLRAGTDGNTIVSECFRLTPAASQVSFMASDTVSASFQYAIQYDCANDIITFTHNGLHGVNQWAWQVNGSPANTTSAFSRSFSAASINDISLTVSNGLCSDTHSEQIILDNKLVADFTAPDMICPEDSAVFKDLSTGSIATRLWTFGNGNSSTTATPPAQRYPLTGLETNYLVNLTIANATCHTSASKYLKVFGSCNIAVPTAFTPNNDGLNDYLFPVNAYKADNLEFKVFNRWGQLVFYSRDWTKKWDGRINGILQSTGTYVWMLNYVHRDTKVKYALRGTSTLIR
jgi:gliding motility-associated-like protein